MTTPDDKPLLILDLDETLIYATNRDQGISHDFVIGPWRVCKRPFVDQFFEAVRLNYRLAIWSTATGDYISAILDQIVPASVTLEFQWDRTRCVQCYDPERLDQYWIKDLRKVKRLGYNLDRVLIVDDSPGKVSRNYGNAIYITPYTGNLADGELYCLAKYLVAVADTPNFRRIEKRGWRG